MTEFRIPLVPEDLSTKPHDFPLAFSSNHDLRFSHDLAERVVHDLGFHEPNCILEQYPFDAAYLIAKGFTSLSAELQTALLEGMQTNLKILAAQIPGLTENDDLKSHRSAAKVYVFFVDWLWNRVEHQQNNTPSSSFTPRKKNTPSRRGRASSTSALDWRTLMEGSLSAVAALLSLDLCAVFESDEIDRRMLDLCLAMGMRCLRHWEVLRGAGIREKVFDVFAACAVRHRLETATASALLLAVQKTEQLASIVAEIAQFSEQTHNDDALSRALVLEMTKSSPHDYSHQWDASKGRSQAVKSVSKLLECLGDAVPASLLKQSSALEPYWCCTAYPMRSALVSVLGSLILSLEGEERTNKQHELHQMLDRLHQRFADTNAFTRSRCVTVWVQLTQHKCVPLEYWLDVTRSALERLQDCASTVRKSSLCLLKALVEYNPFGVNMNAERFRATLDLYKRRLQDYPREQRELEHGEREGEIRGSLSEAGTYDQICFVVQQLETAVRFTDSLTESLVQCQSLLSSASVLVVQEVIHYLVVCKNFSVKGIDVAFKATLTLVFSREASLREELLTAFLQLYRDEEDDLKTAQNIVALTVDATIGETTCLEEVLKLLFQQEKISNKVVKLWMLIALDRDTMPVPITTEAKIRGAVFCLSVCAPYCQDLMAENLDTLLQIGFVESLSDGFCVSHICRVLRSIPSHLFDADASQDIACALVQTLFEKHMSDADWFEVAESAVAALYALFPTPDTLFEEILTEMAAAVPVTAASRGDAMDDRDFEAAIHSHAFLRFCFVLGQVAVHQMVYVEICTDLIHRRLADQEKEGETDDPMGSDAHRQELELDALKNDMETELLAPGSLIGHYAPTISKFCHSLASFIETPLPVQISLSCALMKLMSIDGVFCQNNIRLIFTLLQHRKVESVIKENLMIGMSDLMIRFPNLMEPWTSHLYDLLAIDEPSLKRNTLLVLTHLILSDMIKVKGQISKIIILMADEDLRLKSMATNFVNELAQKATRTFNPIYNLFPDILSNLLAETSLDALRFQTIVQYLLKFTNERHGEKLVEKLCVRFEAEESVRVWRGLSFSIRSLQLGERGFRKWMEMLKTTYQKSLADERCFRHFRETCIKMKRNGRSNDLKSLAQRFEADLLHLHEEKCGAVMETESQTTSMDESCELTFAEMSGHDRNSDARSSIDRKRKAEEPEDVQRRSEMRLLGRTSRLDRIPEGVDANAAAAAASSSVSLPPQGATPSEKSIGRVRRESVKSTSPSSPEVERRMSRLSISKEMDEA